MAVPTWPHDVLAYLVRMTEPVSVADQILPGWWCGDLPGGHPAGSSPGGCADLGLARYRLSTGLDGHPGQAGHRVSQVEAIDRINCWLEGWRCGIGRKTWWPGRLSGVRDVCQPPSHMV
ncbi:hypothetical protein [Actinocrispum wychmicini]|uniref:hypothetical protein n=1 Tax=Actinocrispum wychmicini TaxID=1213861 RepID=UPI00104DF8B1|nr:hypothetical protein [Actinocrispum wychmicini]